LSNYISSQDSKEVKDIEKDEYNSNDDTDRDDDDITDDEEDKDDDGAEDVVVNQI